MNEVEVVKAQEKTMDPQTGNMVLPHEVTGGIPTTAKNPDHIADLKAHPVFGKKFDEEGRHVG